MQQLVDDIAAAVLAVDRCGVPFKQFQPGAGPHGEPRLTKLIAISDAFKLMHHEGEEKRVIIVISYEHEPPKIDVSVLVSAFELLCRELLKLPLGDRYTSVVAGCVHPVHRRATVYGWGLAAI